MSQPNTERAARPKMAERALKFLEDPTLKRHLNNVRPAGMQTLLGAVQRAESWEEIKIVVLYQQARSQEQQARSQEQQARSQEQQARSQKQRRGEDGNWSPELATHLLDVMKKAADEVMGDDRKKAIAAAEQLSLVARVHRVVWVEGGGASKEGEDEE